MAMSIWKFPLAVTDRVDLQMPRGAKGLTVQMQAGQPCLWAIVNPDAAREVRVFRIYGTGHPFDGRAEDYVGTFQMQGGALVFHVFEQRR